MCSIYKVERPSILCMAIVANLSYSDLYNSATYNLESMSLCLFAFHLFITFSQMNTTCRCNCRQFMLVFLCHLPAIIPLVQKSSRTVPLAQGINDSMLWRKWHNSPTTASIHYQSKLLIAHLWTHLDAYNMNYQHYVAIPTLRAIHGKSVAPQKDTWAFRVKISA